jgi:pSer/pThr/pTyr-binding forkhead associated (FHA) protein
MLEFHVLSGRQAGTVLSPESLPCVIGRGPETGLRFDDPGVWEQHLEVEVRPGDGVFARRLPPALANLNGAPFEESLLRNGDRLDLGAVTLRFWLSPARQQTFRLREILTWAALALLCVLQAVLVFWFSR